MKHARNRGHAVDSREEGLRNLIAYYKAQINDIRNAPSHSRHRQGLFRATSRLHECERQLTELHGTRKAH